MTEAAKQARREYKRAWNAKNKDKVKAAQDRYWERKTAEAGRADAHRPQDPETGRADAHRPKDTEAVPGRVIAYRPEKALQDVTLTRADLERLGN